MKQIIKRFSGCCVGLLWVLCLAAQPALTRVEYYIDTDPGYNNGTAISFTAGSTNLSNIALNINPTSVTTGVHTLYIRAKDANGAWGHDNRWLFARPYASDTTTPGPIPALTRVEYYFDTDPGYNNGTAISFTAGSTNLSNIALNIDPATLTEGVHVLGIRTKDANGAWSQDNRWLFARPYTNDTASLGAVPNLKQVEYYIDTDPGYGKGVQLAIENVSNLSNFNLSVNISGLTVAAHTLFIRSKDANNAWSLDNKFDFTVSSAAASPSIVVNSLSKKTMCAGAAFSVGYEAKGTYNNGNIFTVQLSSSTGSFTTPAVIGTLTSKLSGVVACVLPNTLTTGTQYKVRVISSAPVVTGITGSDAITINALPATPTITPNGATTFCAGGSVTLTSTAATSYLWSNAATTQSINVNASGNYSVTVSNASGCTAASTATAVTVNPKPAPVITPSHSPVNLCPATVDTLDAGPGYYTYLWSNGATTQSIIVSAAGSYSVTVTYATGCSGTSAPVNVTYSTCPKPAGVKAIVTSATTATLKWKAATCAVGFQLQLRVVGAVSWTTIPVAGIAYKAKNLLPATTYEWQVATVCQASPQILSAYTVGANFTTLVAAFTDPVAGGESIKVSEGFTASLFPNPSRSSATLRIKGAAQNVTVTITDVTGKILWKSLNVNDAQLKLPVEKLSAGVYIINVFNGTESRVLKLVKE